MKYPLVSIIIVNWNGGSVFRDSLESLLKVDYGNYELIIVDNGSTDGSDQKIGKYRVYKFIKNKTNRGFAEANNQGFKVSRGSYVLLLNNDTRVTKNFLKIMVSKMESDKKIGIMQPKIFMMDKKGYLDNAGSFMTRSGFLLHWGYGEKDSEKFNRPREVHTAKGACMLIRREVIEKVGLFDQDFISYFEESDFCGRTWMAGWKVLFYPEAHIFHKVGFTSKKLAAVDVNYHSLKNRIASLYKNLEVKNLFLILIPHIVLLFGLSAQYLARLQFGKFLMVLRAIGWNVLNFGKLSKKRKKVQKLRKVSDDIIFEKLMLKFSIPKMLKHFAATEKNFE